jgi:hypothetical protein
VKEEMVKLSLQQEGVDTIQGLNSGVDKRFSSFPQLPDRLWGHTNSMNEIKTFY